MGNLQKSKNLLQNLVIKQKMYYNFHVFEKPLAQKIYICKNNCKTFYKQMLFERKTENVQFPYEGVCNKNLWQTS